MDRTYPSQTLARAVEILRAKWALHLDRRRTRRDLRALLNLDDALLRDIGLTRDEVAGAADLPSGIDPTAELRRRAAVSVKPGRSGYPGN